MSWQDDPVISNQNSSWQNDPIVPKEQPSLGQQALDMGSKAVGMSPMGMISQGANSAMEGINKIMTPFIPVPKPVQDISSSVFRGSRAAGVGVANMLGNSQTPESVMGVMDSVKRAYQPNFEPRNVKESIGATLGENAPVIGATALSPGIGGPLSYMAQQAGQTGKVSPIPALFPMAKAGKNIGEFTGKKLFSSTMGVSEPAISARYQNPNLEQSPNVTDLTHRLPASVNKLSEAITEGDKKAWETLSKSYVPPGMGYSPEDRAIPKDIVQGILDQTKRELSVYGGGLVGKSAKQAASTLNEISDDINNVGKYSGGKIKSLLGVESSIPKNINLPETTVKGIIQSLDNNINWADDTLKPLNTSLENARVSLDEILKNQNKAYGKAMEPVSEKMNLLKRIQQQFNIRRNPGEGYVPGTATEGNLSNVLRNNKSVVQDTLNELKKHTGEDYIRDLKNAGYAKEFQPGMKAQGSRRTLFGGALGTGVGHFTGSPTLGGMVGAGTGYMLDTQGGPVAGKLIDMASKTPKIESKNIFGSVVGSKLSRGKTEPMLSDYSSPSSKVLTKEVAQKYYDQANGDKELARKLAKKDGWQW